MRKYKIATARGVGRSHLASSTPCQDYVGSKRLSSEGIACIALSDGAGSCSLSHIGSRIIVKSICSLLVSNYSKIESLNDNDLASFVVDFIVANMQKRALLDNQETIKPYSGTLLAIICNKDRYIAIHIGDGVIGSISNGVASVLSFPDNGEYSNTTYFVTDPKVHSSTRIYRGELQNIDAFILMSDGIEESLYNKKEKILAPVCVKMAEWLKSMPEKKVAKILKDNIEQVFTKKSADDCSIVIMTNFVG